MQELAARGLRKVFTELTAVGVEAPHSKRLEERAALWIELYKTVVPAKHPVDQEETASEPNSSPRHSKRARTSSTRYPFHNLNPTTPVDKIKESPAGVSNIRGPTKTQLPEYVRNMDHPAQYTVYGIAKQHGDLEI
ncbi:hypothetical protein BX616_008208, partial [Lobosporangium transversale]